MHRTDLLCFFFFNDTATTEIYTLSLHDALPICAVLNFFRSVDTLVYALVFVAAVGLGPFPGVLAVVAYTTTSLAKLYSEAIEGIEPGPVDAIRSEERRVGKEGRSRWSPDH